MTSKNERDSVSKSLPLFTHNLSHASLRLYVTANSILEGSHEGKDIYIHIHVFFFYRSVKNPVKNHFFFRVKKHRPTKSLILSLFFSFFALSSSHNNINNINLGSYRNKTSCEITSMIYTSNCILSKVVSWRRSAQFHSTGTGVFYI